MICTVSPTAKSTARGAAFSTDVYKRQLYIFRKQERNILTGVLQDGLRAAAAVGHPAGVAKVDDVLVGQPPAQLPHTGQAAQALSLIHI